MTTDFRALCADLADELTQFNAWYIEDNGYGLPKLETLLRRCDAALAEPEPEGPTDAELNALAFGYAQPCFDFEHVQYARAVLARWGQPAPAPPADGEVAELVEWLYEQLHVCLQAPWTPGIKHFGRAANLLERLSPPAPVPVSERLPRPEDCDELGRCWWWQPSHPESGYLEGWMPRPRFWGVGHYDLDDRLTHTHWLPAHALPLP